MVWVDKLMYYWGTGNGKNDLDIVSNETLDFTCKLSINTLKVAPIID